MWNSVWWRSCSNFIMKLCLHWSKAVLRYVNISYRVFLLSMDNKKNTNYNSGELPRWRSCMWRCASQMRDLTLGCWVYVCVCRHVCTFNVSWIKQRSDSSAWISHSGLSILEPTGLLILLQKAFFPFLSNSIKTNHCTEAGCNAKIFM